ncbi:MAG TPA: pyridoxal-phosphate dependent enzyme [Actinomycetota bacterium]|jgi:threonine dehydratase|nr:pyridoxal-phosphate dependent enzyme [Actinomycetota bacterium]
MTGAPDLARIDAARDRTAGIVRRTPTLPLELGGQTLWLKLELLQPIASFKLRGAAAAVTAAPPEATKAGLLTASAGNMAQGAAWMARHLGVPCSVVVPSTAPAAKLRRIAELGADTIPVSFDRWWQTFVDRTYPGMQDRFFVHPFLDTEVMAGNGVIARELAEDLPAGVEALLVPWGGGGLACGIAAGLRELRPEVRVHAVEVEGAAPLAASLAAGEVVSIDYQPSFVDGIGSKTVFPEMLDLARELLAGSLVVPVAAVAGAVRALAEDARVVAEGAGAAGVAAASLLDASQVACVVSGGNIDSAKLAKILAGGVP